MNTLGSYKCYCQDGYRAQPDGSCRNARTCYHANCQYGCEVIKGAVRCTCPSPGLRLGPDRRTCVDIDECVSGGGVCPRRRKCVNTFGSFVCKCHLGFKLTYINGRYNCI
ncbi:epidermal growth factor-like protein 6, partial [Plectropomus leopardus]|uniref:epidermal growth factor-like protein 6 n=1 Tax=Plectropomus leopardus TaxID=160734 RepID=UPI001C4D87E1